MREHEISLWSERNWHLALKAPNPGEAYREFEAAINDEPEPVNIDELENKDWLRAQ